MFNSMERCDLVGAEVLFMALSFIWAAICLGIGIYLYLPYNNQ